MLAGFDNMEKLKTNQINLDETQKFYLVTAYDQLKDIKTSMLRPKKTPGAEPDIAFEVKFIGS